ncbi:hypothetical protein ABW636_20475 [Aquimarina sp. 2201CG1-2-11]|uniref:hypothetical protein n=1 Tax=Aquimarina discodermiae TaxID=3231043 RepID=UPI003461D083
MTNTLKDTYDFSIRLAKSQEVAMLVDFLSKENWKNHLATKSPETPDSSEEEIDSYMKKEKKVIAKLIKNKVMLQEYKNFNVSIFIYNYIQEREENTIQSMTFRVLKTGKGMEKLESSDTIFDMERLKEHTYRQNRLASGRRLGPKETSIQKALEIKHYIKTNPSTYETMDDVCRIFGFSKTTYYRVEKWLATKNY